MTTCIVSVRRNVRPCMCIDKKKGQEGVSLSL